MHNPKSNEFEAVNKAMAELNPEVSLTVGEVVTMKALEYRVLSFGKKEVRLEILGRVPSRNRNTTQDWADGSKAFGDGNYFEAQPGVHVCAWSPDPPATVNAKATQVHLQFKSSLGTSRDPFQGAGQPRLGDRRAARAPRANLGPAVNITFEMVVPNQGSYRNKTVLLEDLAKEVRDRKHAGVMKKGGAYRVELTVEPIASCRKCGCTENHACQGGCWWVEPDLCSSCVDGKRSDGR